MKQGLPVAGRRNVVAGTGPLLLAVADFLRSKGARGSLARSPEKLVAGISLRARLLRTRYSTDSYVVEVAPAPGGLRVAFQAGQRTDSIECDYFACGFNLIRNVELPTLLGCDLVSDGFVSVDNYLHTSVKNIYAVGELTGIGGVEKAVIEGRIAAHAATGNNIAADLLSRDHMAVLRFTRRLADAFALRPELLRTARPDTIICRCEDVRLASLEGSISGRDAKLQTRCGMGPCQGRVCGPILQRLKGAEPQQVRPPIFPVTIATLAMSGASMSRVQNSIATAEGRV